MGKQTFDTVRGSVLPKVCKVGIFHPSHGGVVVFKRFIAYGLHVVFYAVSVVIVRVL